MSGTPALAFGTLGTDDLLPLLQQRPKQMAEVRAAYELSDSAFAETRLGSHFRHLSGARIGPYTVQLHRRAALEPRERQLLICTKTRFLDRKGRELRQDAIFDAVRVKEEITTMLIQDTSEPARCPT
ncbi:MAG: hypothetical protein ABIP59_19355 [Roseateles sp.]|uniref:hypothetical protein n=1 Tax=Roseateles sp. TaxID=1971397 RepID=UPI003265C363